MNRKERSALTLERLRAAYPDAHCALDHENAYQLTAATILSAQCTDERVNMVTPVLFKAYPTPHLLAAAPQEDVQEIIRSTGFYRNKAKSLVGMARRVVDEFGGEVPDTMEDLLSLPGVARKTANVVLGNAFGKNEGVVVDTHVQRLSGRIGLTSHTDTGKIEKDLIKNFPRNDWTMLSHWLIWHGRRVCMARWPHCGVCTLGKDGCRSFQPDVEKWKAKAKRQAAKAAKASKPPRKS